MEVKNKNFFLSKVSVGSTIAFVKNNSMKSGRVIEIQENGTFVVQTKSFSIYYVKPKDFVWLKLGSFWPEGIHNALNYNRKEV